MSKLARLYCLGVFCGDWRRLRMLEFGAAGQVGLVRILSAQALFCSWRLYPNPLNNPLAFLVKVKGYSVIQTQETRDPIAVSQAHRRCGSEKRALR